MAQGVGMGGRNETKKLLFGHIQSNTLTLVLIPAPSHRMGAELRATVSIYLTSTLLTPAGVSDRNTHQVH